MEHLDSDAPIACSLNDGDFRERRLYARQRLIPKVTKLERIKNGLIFSFKVDANFVDDVNTFVELERQCCGFLTFTIITDENDPLNTAGLKIEGPPEAAQTIEMFAQAVEPATSQTSAGSCNDADSDCGCTGIGDILSSDNFTVKRWLDRIKRTGWSGVIMGGLAILACELPILLAALGLGGLSAGAMALKPPQVVETIAIITAMLGALCLIVLFASKVVLRRKHAV